MPGLVSRRVFLKGSKLFSSSGSALPADALQSPSRSAAATSNWAAIASLALGVFGLVMAEFLPISLLTAMATDLGVSDGAAGQAVTATALVGAAAVQHHRGQGEHLGHAAGSARCAERGTWRVWVHVRSAGAAASSGASIRMSDVFHPLRRVGRHGLRGHRNNADLTLPC